MHIQMDYKQVLHDNLFSQINVDFLIQTIMTNFKLKQNAIRKSVSIVISYLESYMPRIDPYPRNSTEVIEAIQYLNKRCIDDFAAYLLTKFPGEDIYRPKVTAAPTPRADVSTPTPQTAHQQPATTEVIILDHTQISELLLSYSEPRATPEPEPILESMPKPDPFSDPIVLQMINLLASQAPTSSAEPLYQCQSPIHSNIVIDQVLDANQLAALLAQSTKPAPAPTPMPAHVVSPQVSAPVVSQQVSAPVVSPQVSAPVVSPQVSAPLPELVIDLANLNSETVLALDIKLKQLLDLKDICLAEGNMDRATEIDGEKTDIINAIVEYRQRIIKQRASRPEPTTKTAHTWQAGSNTDSTYDDLNLELDPTQDHNDLRNITVGLKLDRSITEIVLMGYRVPFNAHNVTRFNNRFPVYFNGRINRVSVPTGTYTIELLMGAITSQASFLDLTVDGKGFVTVRNTLNLPFDLMIEDGTLYQVLGFTERSDEYKGELTYRGAQPFDLNANRVLTLGMLGSSKDPINLEFDADVTLEEPAVLKRVARGFTQKQITLNLKDKHEQLYDFVQPFQLHIRINYLTLDEAD